MRMFGSIALSLCFVAAGALDGCSACAPSRSVDAAAGQLIVREAGGAVRFPTRTTSLGAGLRSTCVAACAGDPGMLERAARRTSATVEP